MRFLSETNGFLWNFLRHASYHDTEFFMVRIMVILRSVGFDTLNNRDDGVAAIFVLNWSTEQLAM